MTLRNGRLPRMALALNQGFRPMIFATRELPPPAIVQQHSAVISTETVLSEYASYYYGDDELIRHSSNRLRQFARAAWDNGLHTVADYFERLAERAEEEEDREEWQSAAEYQSHIRHLARDYR